MNTGQIIVRETTAKHNGRRIVMVFGVLALDENSNLKGEHQYTVVGGGGSLRFDDRDGKDMTARSIGNTPDGLLREPIWKV